MEKVFSNGELFHIIYRKDDFDVSRFDIVDPQNFIQVAALNLPAGTTFKPHKHKYKFGPNHIIAQESWVVISGSVKAILYGGEDTIIKEVILKQGDASITLNGGHTYEILEPGTLVYEFKTGPYRGQESDKVFI
jgi:cupin fold WbuC family metalloprotein